MTDTPTSATTSSAPATESAQSPAPVVEVTKPFVSAKPYDDEMLEAYEADSPAEEASEEASTEPAKEEVTTEESSEEKLPDPPKAKEGDKEIDGVENLPIKKIINGKEVEFKIKDAVQAYVKQEEFNRNMDRRITHVSQREKAVEKNQQAWANDQAAFKANLGQLMKVAQQGDFVTAVRALAKIALAGSPSGDVTEFEKKYFDQLDKVNEVYTKLTPEQREAYFAKRAKAEADERLKALEDEKTATVEQSQLQSQVETLTKSNGLAPEEFWSNYKAMEENLVGEGNQFKDPSEITPEKVVEFSLLVRHEAKVLEAAEKAGISDQAVRDELSRITAVRPDYTVDDIVKVIEVSGLGKQASAKAVENLNRKAGKSNIRFSQASSTKKENGIPEGYDEETLNDLYRKSPRVYARPVR